jgi:hypothetical protein
MTFITGEYSGSRRPPRRGLRVYFSAGVRMGACGGEDDCLLATAARNQWGGEWRVSGELVQHWSDDGVVTVWRTSSDARMVMDLFDSGRLVPYLSVVMTRGYGICSA